MLGYVVEYRESFVPRSSPDAYDEVRAGDWTEVILTAAHINSRTVTITQLKDRRSGSATGRGVSFDVRVRATNDHDGDGSTNNPTPTEGGPWAMTSAAPATQPGSIGADEFDSEANIDIEPGFKLLTVTWNPPDDGGTPITHYLLNYAEGDTGQFETDIRVDATGPPPHHHRARRRHHLLRSDPRRQRSRNGRIQPRNQRVHLSSTARTRHCHRNRAKESTATARPATAQN